MYLDIQCKWINNQTKLSNIKDGENIIIIIIIVIIVIIIIQIMNKLLLIIIKIQLKNFHIKFQWTS